MEKIKLLIAPGDNAGSGKFRCIDPHVCLQNNFSNDFFIEINYQIDFNDTDYLKKFDAIFIHRIPQHHNKEAIDILHRIRKLGLKIIIDIDDYWQLDPSHGLYILAKKDKLAETMIECLKLADLVTVPTTILANEVKKLNKNVVVLENAINPNELQFQHKPIINDKTKVIWCGGSSHFKDIELLSNLGQRANELKNLQLILAGFDTRGEFQQINSETNEIQTRKIKPQETSYYKYELSLTNNYRNLANDKEYLSYLSKFIDDSKFDTTDKPYQRIWTKPITQYATSYNHADIALAPLNDSTFNKYKSELKTIEAGFHHLPIIAQNYGPYTINLINSVEKGGNINKTGNALLVETSKNHKQWFKYVKLLHENKALREDLGEKLYETVKDKYDLNNVTKYRREYYLELMK